LSNTEQAATVVIKDEPKEEGRMQFDQFDQILDMPDDMFDFAELLSGIDMDPVCGASSEQDMMASGHGQYGGLDEWQQQYGGVDANNYWHYDNASFQLQNLDANMMGSLPHADQAPIVADNSRDFIRPMRQDSDYGLADDQGMLKMSSSPGFVDDQPKPKMISSPEFVDDRGS